MTTHERFIDYLAWRWGAHRLFPFERFMSFLKLVRLSSDLSHRDFSYYPEAKEEMKLRSMAEVKAEYVALVRANIHFLSPLDPEFPESLFCIPDPPRALFVEGEVSALKLNGLAVVGARDVSSLTLEWMESELSAFLKSQPGISIISGGARGVDQCAHRIALRSGHPTLVLLPSGLSEIYPRHLAVWKQAIFDSGGALVTEYSPETKMRKGFFAERNRLISGLARATLILEAAARSGTLLTARAAAEQGRALFVLPGHPRDRQFSGSLELLAEGAVLLRDAQELTAFFRAELKNSYSDIKLFSTNSSIRMPQH